MGRSLIPQTTGEWIATMFVLAVAGSLLVLPFNVAPAFRAMAPQGAGLPPLGRLVLTSWFAPLVGLVPAALLSWAYRWREGAPTLAQRLRWTAVLAALAALLFCLAGLAEVLLQSP